MHKIIRFFLGSTHKRRRRMVSLVLFVLRILRDAESDNVWRCSDLLDSFDSGSDGASRHMFNAIEDECINCEHALSTLESIIDDLVLAYQV